MSLADKIIKKRKSSTDRRVVLATQKWKRVLLEFSELVKKVESSDARFFTDEDYKKEGIEVYERPKEYRKSNQNTKATITMNMDLVDTNITQVTYTAAIKGFQSAPKSSLDGEYTAGGKKYDFAVLETGPNTRFIFQSSRTNATLGEATLESNLVVLPNGIRIGSSLEEVMNTLLVYDGTSNPSIITLQDST